MVSIGRLVAGIVAAGILALPSTASASYFLSFTYNDGGVAIADGLLQVEYQPGFFGGTYPFNLSKTTTGFADINTNQPPIIQTYFLGIYGPAAQIAGQPDELVMFVNNAFAANAAGKDFTTVFPGITEGTITQGLVDDFCCENPPNYNSTEAQYMFEFANGEGANASFAPGSSFTIMTFSTGQIVGTGVSTGVSSSVPEPATWAMLLLGLFGVGFVVRDARRKNAAIVA
jgi:hypothetical protein